MFGFHWLKVYFSRHMSWLVCLYWLKYVITSCLPKTNNKNVNRLLPIFKILKFMLWHESNNEVLQQTRDPIWSNLRIVHLINSKTNIFLFYNSIIIFPTFLLLFFIPNKHWELIQVFVYDCHSFFTSYIFITNKNSSLLFGMFIWETFRNLYIFVLCSNLSSSLATWNHFPFFYLEIF